MSFQIRRDFSTLQEFLRTFQKSCQNIFDSKVQELQFEKQPAANTLDSSKEKINGVNNKQEEAPAKKTEVKQQHQSKNRKQDSISAFELNLNQLKSINLENHSQNLPKASKKPEPKLVIT